MNMDYFNKRVNELKFIAHRLGFQMTKYPENSLNVLKVIFENKEMLDSCSGFEFDICFTKDHVPVVIHDKYIDDISNNVGLIKSYNIDELKKMDFGFRKSLTNSLFKFKIVTLDEILKFFSVNCNLLKDKIIKIETKDIVIFSNKNMKILADILNKFPNLSNNIIHLSYHVRNLATLKNIQINKKYYNTKSDLLCDYKIIFKFSRIFKNIDLISLRIKPSEFSKLNKKNSIRVNRKIFFYKLFMKFSNRIDEKTLKCAIKRYGSVGLYVLNNKKDIEQFCKKISNNFFEENYDKIFFTTDNPLYLKKLG